jgi:hypothetical protein
MGQFYLRDRTLAGHSRRSPQRRMNSVALGRQSVAAISAGCTESAELNLRAYFLCGILKTPQSNVAESAHEAFCNFFSHWLFTGRPDQTGVAVDAGPRRPLILRKVAVSPVKTLCKFVLLVY